jgi:hypothetical protein
MAVLLMARINYSHGKPPEAEEICQLALEGLKKGCLPEGIPALFALGVLGRLTEAEEMLQQAVQGFRERWVQSIFWHAA